jgi:hypothetical protein
VAVRRLMIFSGAGRRQAPKSGQIIKKELLRAWFRGSSFSVFY